MLKIEQGKRYLVRFDWRSPISEIEVVEVSPEGRAKIRDCTSGSTRWLDLKQVEAMVVLEELPRKQKPQRTQIVRE